MSDYLTAWVNAHLGKALRDERGLSQSTENALLVVGAVAVATIVVGVITAYINGKLGGLR